MNFTGKLTSISEVKTGTSNGNEWASLEFEVTENKEQYPQIGLFSYFKNGEYIDYAKDFKNNFKLGDLVDVDFNLKRVDYEKNGEAKKFYKTEAWKITKTQSQQNVEAVASKIDDVIPPADDDDLPF